MKKPIQKIFLLCLTMMAGNLGMANAQQMPPVPQDKAIIVGKLPNGLTYYIRHNDFPKNRVQFHIAQKVGSILEEPEQRGLAHFLEHMSFNGTTNFPGNEKGLGLLQWCEEHGLKFGVDINAYTAMDRTVYKIVNVPADQTAVVDSCILILHDWSHDLLLSDKEIDKERGVILEELRSRDNAQTRSIQKIAEQVYGDQKYADCLPGGSMDIVANFKYDTLRRYYHKWYRPDLQGIIIVGDIDPAKIEAEIKKKFADIKAPVNPAERIYYPVADHEEPIIAIASDKESTSSSASYEFVYKTPTREEKSSITYLVGNYLSSLAVSMLDQRYSEITNKSNAPFVAAGSYDSSFLLSEMVTNSFGSRVILKEDNILGGIKSMMIELERAKRFGFTASEYARAKAEYLLNIEKAYKERAKQTNSGLAESCIDNFVHGEPMPSIEQYYTLINQIAPNIPVEALNQSFPSMFTKKNRVIYLMMPKKDGLIQPTKKQVQDIIAEVENLELKPYVDEVSDEPLMKNKPAPGKVIKTEDGIYGTKVLTLSNGAKVYIKPTKLKADQIIFQGFSWGGQSMYNKDYTDVKTADEVATIGGFGNFSTTDLTKVLAGKNASLSSRISTTSESVSGNCSPKDFETMLQLNYLAFTSPRKDKDAFKSWKERSIAMLKNAEANPMTAFRDSLNKALYNDNPYVNRFKLADVEKVNYDNCIKIYKERFENAGDFVFNLVGNIELNPENIALIEQYIGGLPGNNETEKANMDVMKRRTGNFTLDFFQKQEMVKKSVFNNYSMNIKYTPKNILIGKIFGSIMEIRYLKSLREDQGGTYSPMVYADLSKNPSEKASFIVYFDTNPDAYPKLAETVDSELNDMSKNGPSDLNVQKVKSNMLKKHEQSIKLNSYWMGVISEKQKTGIDISTKYEKIVKNISKKDIEKFTKKLLKADSYICVTMTTATKK